MALFKIGKSLTYIKEEAFKLEKDIQVLTENNLQQIFQLELVKSEFVLNSFRIDTLAFDKEANAFVIIEYKNNKKFSIVDQGYAYLASMLNNKADCILEFNEAFNKSLKRSEVDWSQSRILFIAPDFTAYQREAINFKDLPIELWQITKYENDIVAYEPIQKGKARESINTIATNNRAVREVSNTIKVYTETEHLAKTSVAMQELYETLKDAIINLGKITVKPKKKYISFVTSNVASNNVVDICVQKKALKVWINLAIGELDDPKKLTRDVSSTGHWGNGDYELHIKSDEHLEYILSLIKQAVKKHKK